MLFEVVPLIFKIRLTFLSENGRFCQKSYLLLEFCYHEAQWAEIPDDNLQKTCCHLPGYSCKDILGILRRLTRQNKEAYEVLANQVIDEYVVFHI